MGLTAFYPMTDTIDYLNNIHIDIELVWNYGDIKF